MFAGCCRVVASRGAAPDSAGAAARMRCDGEGVMEQERQFLAALESATQWAIERDLLDLHRADGERALLARPGGQQVMARLRAGPTGRMLRSRLGRFHAGPSCPSRPAPTRGPDESAPVAAGRGA